MKVSEEPVCVHLFRQKSVFTSLHLKSPVHVVPPLSSVFCQMSYVNVIFYLSHCMYIVQSASDRWLPLFPATLCTVYIYRRLLLWQVAYMSWSLSSVNWHLSSVAMFSLIQIDSSSWHDFTFTDDCRRTAWNTFHQYECKEALSHKIFQRLKGTISHDRDTFIPKETLLKNFCACKNSRGTILFT